MPLSKNDVGTTLPSRSFDWDTGDVILYALSVGAGVEELPYVYEGSETFNTLPTFAVVPGFPVVAEGIGSELDFDPTKTLHGSHRIELHSAIPTAGTATTTGEVTEVWDKGENAVVVARGDTRSADGALLFTNTFTAFIRGAGGFGGDRGPSSSATPRPDREPDRVLRLPTHPDQAALYRLNGDLNPLHVDPDVAAQAGFPRPILHGLCTYGIVGRAIVTAFCERDGSRLRSYEARFSGVVFPGETLLAHVWEVDEGLLLEVLTEERGEVVLDRSLAELA